MTDRNTEKGGYGTSRPAGRPARGIRLIGLAVCLLLGLTACSPRTTAEKPAPAKEPLTATQRHGPVELLFEIFPPEADLARVSLLSLTATTPQGVEVVFPPLTDRLEGFVANDVFTTELPPQDDRRVFRLTARLTPTLSARYRIAPMALAFRDLRQDPPVQDWFPTRPVTLQRLQQPEEQGTPAAVIEPLWISPSPAMLALWLVYLLLTAAALWALWKLSHRVRRQIRLMRMSPKERALEELRELLAKDYPARDLFKDFYLELTWIVRRFIERQHRIRAPEQTTQEFLAAVADHPRFPATVVSKLKTFLESADLVKFAAYHPDPAHVENSVATARDYIASSPDRARENPEEDHA